MRRRTAPSALLLALLFGAAAVAACSPLNDAPGPSSTATAVPSGAVISATPDVSGVPSDEPSDVSPSSGDSATSGMTQTNTAWGRIWDALPRTFPIYPGSSASTEIGAPASGQFVVPTDVATATAWAKSALDATGLRTTVSGPLEDGSMRLDSVGPAGCAVQTTIAREGAATTMTVLYGATCAFS
jgi:hypothetical protein